MKNAAAHLQEHVSQCFKAMQGAYESWPDDFDIHTKNAGDAVEHLETFLITSKEFNLKLSAKKCRFFEKKIIWCGRIIDAYSY